MKKFTEFNISKEIQMALEQLGFEEATIIQELAIPIATEGKDLIGQSQTGTGKTFAFGIPILENILQNNNHQIQALVICPTRELAVQVSNEFDKLTAFTKIRNIAVYGGEYIDKQIKGLKKKVQIVIGTPGRILDHIERKTIKLDHVRFVVLDEADEMLTMGFSESLQTILAEVPKERHLLLFSATMPREISSIAASYMHQPKEIIVGTKNEGNKNIRHYYYVVSARHKYLALKRIADYYPDIYGIIFCRTRRETQEIADQLIRDGYNADALHGELSQAQRDYVMQKFRIRNLQLLVATDVAARGLDVNDLTHVIHYGLPDDIESYTHRSGRTARAGKMGISIAICHSRERGRLRDIERISHTTIERKQLPTGQAICEKQLFHLADRIERVELTEDTTLDTVLPELVRKLDWIDREELVRRLMLLEHRRLLDYYESEETIEEADDKGRLSGEGKEGKKRDKRNAVAEEGMKRLFINFGKLDRMFPNKLIELINKCVPGRVKIGKIDLLPRFAFFEVEEADAQEVIRSMSSYEVDGRRIAVDYADAMGSGDSKKERRSRRNQDFAPERKSYRKGSKSSEGAFDKYKGGKSSKGGKKKNRW